MGLRVTGCLPERSILSCASKPPRNALPLCHYTFLGKVSTALELAYDPHLIHHTRPPLRTRLCPPHLFLFTVRSQTRPPWAEGVKYTSKQLATGSLPVLSVSSSQSHPLTENADEGASLESTSCATLELLLPPRASTLTASLFGRSSRRWRK